DGVNESDTNKTHNPTPTEPKKPKTGDDSNIMLYVLMLLTSGGVFGAIEFIRMRRRLREN
ncbi:LPXTG cell wall anchor domain-containing protein, partial [Eggerthia catenaformis]